MFKTFKVQRFNVQWSEAKVKMSENGFFKNRGVDVKVAQLTNLMRPRPSRCER